jgi:hypothetical protein
LPRRLEHGSWLKRHEA